LLIRLDQLPEPFVCSFADALDSGGIVDVGHRREIGSHVIKPFVQGHLPLIFRLRPAAMFLQPGNQHHVRRRSVEIEIFGHVFFKDGRSERPEFFPVFYFQIQFFLCVRQAGIRQNTAIAQGPRTIFHASLEPADHQPPEDPFRDNRT
jgi:hypothetical protein